LTKKNLVIKTFFAKGNFFLQIQQKILAGLRNTGAGGGGGEEGTWCWLSVRFLCYIFFVILAASVRRLNSFSKPILSP
jgi:hypothetical protein